MRQNQELNQLKHRAHFLPNTHSQNNSKAPKFPKVRTIMVFQSRACNELKNKERDKKAQRGQQRIHSFKVGSYGQQLIQERKCLNHFKMCMSNQVSTRVKSSSRVQVIQSAITHERKLGGIYSNPPTIKAQILTKGTILSQCYYLLMIKNNFAHRNA